MFEQKQILRVHFLKSWSFFINEEVQFFEPYQKKSSIFESYPKRKSSILWVIVKKVQFCESYSKKKKVQFCESYSKKKQFFDSYGKKKFHSKTQKKVQCFESFFSKKKFISLSHIWKKKVQFFASYLKKGPILCVIYKKKVSFFASKSRNKGFNSLRHIQESPILWSY